MDLYSPKDKILLRNCMVIKLEQLRLSKQTPAIQDEINYYKNLREILNMDDTDTLKHILNDSTLNDSYRAFNDWVLSSSRKEIAEEFIALTKSMMQEHGLYTEEDFQSLKKVFYTGNEDLLENAKTTNPNELEEEPSTEPTQNDLTLTEKKCLSNLQALFQRNSPQTLAQFREFSTQFRDGIKLLGMSKFQQSFEENGKKLVDMQISYESANRLHPVYTTDFLLLDSENTPSQQSVQAPAFPSGFTANYYQALCFSYLEADQCTEMEDVNMIPTKMNTFSECYQRLKEMTPKFKIKIKGQSMFYSHESNYVPHKEIEAPENIIPFPDSREAHEIG